ncbi:MAG: uroporphyrinogen-III synthase [Hyphomonadaceae bacterium]
MSLRVAITRAAPEAARTAARVRERGGEPVLAPLLTITPCGFDASLEGVQALLFTSANGARAFPDVRGAAGVRVLAVGDATAQAAREASFLDVSSAGGDVSALIQLAKSILQPGGGKVVHISGAHVAGDLTEELSRAGFQSERRVAYAAVAAAALPPAFDEPLDIVLFHSPRAARTFIALGAPGAERLMAGCISPAVAAAAGAVRWKRVITATAPREDDLLAATMGG